MGTQPFDDIDDPWLRDTDDATDDATYGGAAFDDEEETLEFVITSADEEDETTWEWDGSDWRRVA
jgi:hypothetical protein